VSGGGGGGNGGDGTGAGAGLVARPVGVYVLRGGEVTWSPAVDVTRIVLGGQLVAVAGMLLVRALLRHRSATRGGRGRRSRRLR
jgi:NAD(P)H-hydrate repair Nnr-like enzyme with NAD(P)H-hydrate epimerase domain